MNHLIGADWSHRHNRMHLVRHACSGAGQSVPLERDRKLAKSFATNAARVVGLALLSIGAAWAAGPTGLLNDTGITGYSNDSQNGLTTEPPGYPRQDARMGRDAAVSAGQLPPKIGGGGCGFDFTKIANNGTVLAANAALGSGPTDWACTRDNVTNLIWEVKTTAGLRSQSHTYTSYNSNSATNGGAVGTASGGTCATAGRCDTEKFVQDVNAAGLCGPGTWRMPTVKELEGIADLSRVNPAIDPTYFQNTLSSQFWSGSPTAGDTRVTWYVNFNNGYSQGFGFRTSSFAVRLVRDGP